MYLKIDNQIMTSDKVICRHIDSKELFSIGEISQDILSQLRHLVEHIMLKIYANGNDIEDSQDNITNARKYVKNKSELRFISHFHRLLEVSAPHRTLMEENAKRLMNKYYIYLLKIKKYIYDNYSMEILHNLENFPLGIGVI